MFVYKIINTINDKIYIGKTRNIEKRFRTHCSLFSHSCISGAIKKYGHENFSIKQIDRAKSIRELNDKEKKWIKFYNCISPNGYNLTKGGDGISNPSEEIRNKIRIAKTGKRASKETRRKMSAKRIGKTLVEYKEIKCQNILCNKILKVRIKSKKKYCSLLCKYSDPNLKQKLSLKHKGKIISEEQRRKISDTLKGNIPWNKGKNLSEKHCENLSKSHKGKTLSEEQKRKISESLKLAYMRKRRDS